MASKEEKCGCPCHRSMGVLVVLFGLTFLLGTLGVISSRTMNIAWPIIVMLAGLKKTMRGMCKCCAEG